MSNNELPSVDVTAREWLNGLREEITNGEMDKALHTLDNLPKCLISLELVGDGHVIIPHSEEMTEEMINASRGLLLWTDTFSTNNAEAIRQQLALRPWTERHLPQWFNELEGHLTKAGRAILAHHLTVEAALYPPDEEEEYFSSPRRKPIQEFYWGFEMTLSDGDESLVISKGYESFWDRRVDGDIFDLQINRHQLPDHWKKYFKKAAIEISGRITMTDDVMDLSNAKVRMAVKNSYVGKVTHTIQTAIKIPKKAVRNID